MRDEFPIAAAISHSKAIARRGQVIQYRSLPAGDYEVRSVLFDARGEERAMVTQAVAVLNAGGR